MYPSDEQNAGLESVDQDTARWLRRGAKKRRRTARTMVAANTAISATSTRVTTSAVPGYTSARTPSPTTKPSSARLSSQFETGSGLVLATARVPALVR